MASPYGIIVDLPDEEKKIANLSFGLSCAFLGPLIIKRMIFDVDDDTCTLSAIVGTIFIPGSLVCIMIGMGAVCVGIDTPTGIFICAFGSFTFFGYFAATAYRMCSKIAQKKRDEARIGITEQVNTMVLGSLENIRKRKIEELETAYTK